MLNWYDRGCLCRKTWLIVSGNMTRSPALRLVGFKGVELSFVSKSLAPLHRGVWASQEPPISTALLTHLGTALRALHSCRLLRLPVALTGICSHPALGIHWSRLTASMQMTLIGRRRTRNHDQDVPSTSLY